ncbi:MAG TPA: sucrase ferredoxin [Nocardioidaceae bacterium]|nr:sucrase ferredoxin [Nocardioidaceae bacterium]
MRFRCAAASLGREEPATGTASTVRAFLLVENAGPWGVDALVDARMPQQVKEALAALAAASGVRVLLVRRHAGAPSGPGLRVFAAYADPSAPWLESSTVSTPADLLRLDLPALGRGESPGLTPDPEPVFCVCTHGRHDTCCAELGRPTASALAAAQPGRTWEVSHIGGDRFAANVLVLPDGLYYGRVPAAGASALATLHLSGHLDLDLLRGRSGLGFAAQVAEVAVRREVGETRTSAVHLVGTAPSARGTTVRFDVAGTTYDVRVRESVSSEEHQLTCRAQVTNPVPTYDVVSVQPATR